MKPATIDMQRIREGLPNRAVVNLKKKQTDKGTVCYIECIIRWPGLYDKGTITEGEVVREVFEWQEKIIGEENISEFYTEEEGSHWFIFLKRVPLDFINTTDEDIKNYSGYSVEQLSKTKEVEK